MTTNKKSRALQGCASDTKLCDWGDMVWEWCWVLVRDLGLRGVAVRRHELSLDRSCPRSAASEFQACRPQNGRYSSVFPKLVVYSYVYVASQTTSKSLPNSRQNTQIDHLPECATPDHYHCFKDSGSCCTLSIFRHRRRCSRSKNRR